MMFRFYTVFIHMLSIPIFLLCFISLLYSVPRQRHALAAVAYQRTGQEMPPIPFLSSLFPGALMTAVASWFGARYAPQAQLRAPLLSGLIESGQDGPPLLSLLAPGLAGGLAGGLVVTTLYYQVIRPWIGRERIGLSEDLRREMGLLTRVLSSGVIEEVLFRWGLMGGMAGLFGWTTPAALWTANLIAAAAYGLSALAGLAMMPSLFGVSVRPRDIIGTFSMHTLVGLLLGWIFWQYGLAASILAHSTIFLVWAPLEWRNKS